MDGNVMIDGKRRDTGMYWADSSGVSYRIFRKKISIGALPNSSIKNVPHIEAIDPTKYCRIISFYAHNGSSALLTSANTQIEIDATNVIVSTTIDLSDYTFCEIEIEWAIRETA